MGANCEMFSTNAVLNLYLKWTGDYSIQLVNYMPLGVPAVGIVGTLVLGWYSDFSGGSWHVGVLTSLTAIVSGVVMLSSRSKTATMFALYLNGIQYANQTVMFAWASRTTFDDAPKRSIILAAMNTAAVAFYCWWPLLFYAADQAPAWHAGSIAIIVCGVAMLGGVLVIRHLERRPREIHAMPASVDVQDGYGQGDDYLGLEKGGKESTAMTDLGAASSISSNNGHSESTGK